MSQSHLQDKLEWKLDKVPKRDIQVQALDRIPKQIPETLQKIRVLDHQPIRKPILNLK